MALKPVFSVDEWARYEESCISGCSHDCKCFHFQGWRDQEHIVALETSSCRQDTTAIVCEIYDFDSLKIL